jgi:phospho-N-acetylmuramoyl-pentapeptide-transferase
MKLAGQGIVALIAFVIVLLDPAYRESLCEIWLPILNGPLWSAKSLGWPFLACLGVAGAFFVLVCVGCSNAVNLTDGLDGLAIGCVLITTMILGAVAYLAGHHEFATYLRISYVPGAGELAVFCSALVGGSLVFLWHNSAPAEIYMGDVGALGLGGGLGAVACLMHQPFLLAIVGGVFVVEAISVILQVAYFKRTGGQRLFLMTPIHHHFQKKGWPATKVVARFWILSLLCGLLGLLSLKLR